MRRRKHDRSQAIHARLEAQLRSNLDDPRAVRAYAESLHARGDPLGELMLLSLRAEEFARQQRAAGRDELLWGAPSCAASERAEQMISEQWHAWFGDLSAKDVNLRWQHGLVRRASLSCYANVDSLNRLLLAPPMQFVEAVNAGELIGRREWLAVPTGLKELVIPATLALDVPGELARLGSGLILTGSLRELQTWRDRLRSCFPGVKLQPRLPVPAIDADFVGPRANPEPRWAGRGPTECARTMEDRRPFRFCGACASEDTDLLAALPDPVSNRTSVTYEYVCRECGWFTWYAIVDVEPYFPRPAPVRKARKPRPRIKLAS
ncbi:MAG: hypothetical protein QM723_27360 [Myxococcaceae bacterium]